MSSFIHKVEDAFHHGHHQNHHDSTTKEQSHPSKSANQADNEHGRLIPGMCM